MSSNEDESSDYEETSSEGNAFAENKARMSPFLLQQYVGHKYSYLASLDYVKAMARKHGHGCKMIGDTKALGKHVRHGPNSLDTIIAKAMILVRTINPEWDLQIIRFETISQKQKLVFPNEPYLLKVNDRKSWKTRYKCREYIIITHPKFTTYIALDDSFKDAPKEKTINPCGWYARMPRYEEPIPEKLIVDMMMKSLETGKTPQELEQKKEEENPE